MNISNKNEIRHSNEKGLSGADEKLTFEEMPK